VGRKSALTDAQWEEVDKLLLADVPAREIGRRFDVSEATIRNRKNSRTAEIRNAAEKVVEAERALTKLPVSAQRVARTFAQKLQAMSDSLAEAAMLGAQTAAHLHGIAARKALAVTDTNIATASAVQGLAQVEKLTGMANDAADIAVRVVSAQKDQVKKAHEVPPADAPDLSNLSPEELAALEATMSKVTPRLGGDRAAG
jgi:hypothetical protein